MAAASSGSMGTLSPGFVFLENVGWETPKRFNSGFLASSLPAFSSPDRSQTGGLPGSGRLKA